MSERPPYANKNEEIISSEELPEVLDNLDTQVEIHLSPENIENIQQFGISIISASLTNESAKRLVPGATSGGANRAMQKGEKVGGIVDGLSKDKFLSTYFIPSASNEIERGAVERNNIQELITLKPLKEKKEMYRTEQTKGFLGVGKKEKTISDGIEWIPVSAEEFGIKKMEEPMYVLSDFVTSTDEKKYRDRETGRDGNQFISGLMLPKSKAEAVYQEIIKNPAKRHEIFKVLQQDLMEEVAKDIPKEESLLMLEGDFDANEYGVPNKIPERAKRFDFDEKRNPIRLKKVSSAEHQLLDNLADLETEAGVIDLKQKAEEQQAEIEKKKALFLTKLTQEVESMILAGAITKEAGARKISNAHLIDNGLADSEEGLMWQARMFANAGILSEEQTINLLNDQPVDALTAEQSQPEEAEPESEPEDVTAPEEVEKESLLPTSKEEFDALLPESERDISMVEDFEAGVAAAETFEDLIATIQTVDNIEGTLGFYSSQQLVELIRMVARGEQTPLVITRNAGLRAQVLTIMNSHEHVAETPDPDPTSPETNTSTLDEKAAHFTSIRDAFVDKEERYYAALETEMDALTETKIMDRLRAAFGADREYEKAHVEQTLARKEHQEMIQEYVASALDYQREVMNQKYAGEVCFSDLDKKTKLQVQQLALEGVISRGRYGDEDVVEDSVLELLLEKDIIAQDEIETYKTIETHEVLVATEKAKIWNTLYLQDTSRVAMIKAEHFDKKDTNLFQRLMYRTKGQKKTSTAETLFAIEGIDNFLNT